MHIAYIYIVREGKNATQLGFMGFWAKNGVRGDALDTP